jgi:branched-subunit amino acid ABC-type transport system permease component
VTTYAPFLIAGLVVGSVYAIAALGLVVTYRTTGLFNFAHGAVAMVVAYAFYELRTDLGFPTLVAAVVALAVVAPAIGLVVDRWLFRRLDEASQASKVVVTLGLLIALQGAVAAIFGATTKTVAPFLPQETVKVGSVFVGYDQMIVLALGVAVLGGLTLFFRNTRLGVVMRALVDNRHLAESAGFSSTRVSGITWAIGVVLAGIAGILFSPLLGLDTVTLTLLVVQAYAAAIFGRLESLPRTFVAALLLGVASSMIIKPLSSHPDILNGLRPSLPFLLLFAILVMAKRGSLRELGVSAPWAGTVRARVADWKVVAVVLLPIALLLPSSRVFALGAALVLACSFLSITVLTGSSGLISLTQAGLGGTGAFAYIHFVHDAHIPFPIALVLAGLVAIPLGLAIAVPALRLPGLFLALATFGFGELMDGLFFTSWKWFSGGGDGLHVARPELFRSDRDYVLFLVLMVVLFVLVIGAFRRSALGRTLTALRDSPAAAESLGINALWPKIGVFSISAFLAGVSGGLYAGLLGVASKSFFTVFTSLFWVTVVVVGGIESVFGAILGAFVFGFVPTFFAAGTSATITQWMTPAFGVGAILLARRPGGLVELISAHAPRRLIAVRRTAEAPARLRMASDG